MEPQQPTAFFVHGPSPFARLILFGALSLALMATDARLHYLTEIRQGFVALLHPLEIVANVPVTLYRSVSEYMVTHNTLLRENRRLGQLTLDQGANLQNLKTLQSENERLRDLLGAAKLTAQPTKLAEIVHTGRDPFTHKVVVNIGARQNIQAGQAVVDTVGVIGQVTRVYPFTSEVTLITDKSLAIPVQIERNGLRAIAFGHGRDNLIDLPYMPSNVDIQKGDRLVTSGIDGVYPTGLGVAEVIKIESSIDSPYLRISCKPVADVENHFHVLLVGAPTPEIASGNVINKRVPPSVQMQNPTENSANSTPHAITTH